MISLVIEQAGRVRRQDLPLLPATVGRAGTADVHLESDLASRLHARFYESEGHIWLEDLGSRNGTTLNGRPVDRVPLRCGDAVGVGDCRLTVAALALDDELVELKGYQWVRLEGGSVDGVLWRARQTSMAREVTVKILRGRFRGVPQVEDLFVRRARDQARLAKPWLQTVLDVVDGDGCPCVVLEAIDGELLSHRLERGEELSAAEAEGLVERLLEATCELHGAGLLHGLLHPGRILLTGGGGIQVATLGFPLPSLDAWPDGPAPSLAYLPPEAAGASPGTGVPGDLYQVGAVAWRLLTGSPLRAGHDRDEILDEVAAAADEPPDCGIPGRGPWFARMIDGRPGHRYATADEALDAFRRGMRRLPAPAPSAAGGEPRVEEPSESARKKRLSPRFIMLNRVITVVLMIVLNGAVFLWWSGRPPKSREEPRRPGAVRIETPPPVRGDPEPPAPGDPLQGPGPVDEAAAARAEAFAELEGSLEGWLDRRRFEEALAALQEFATGHLGTREAGMALARAAGVEQELSDYAKAQLASVEAAIRNGDWEGAEALRRDLGGRSDRVDRDRLAAVDADLARRRAEAAPAGPGGGDPPGPEPQPGPPGTGDRAAFNERAIALLARPLDGEARRLLMEEGGRDAFEPWVWRGLQALDSATRAWVDSMQALVDKRLEIDLADGSKVAGSLLGTTAGGLLLAVEGVEEEFAMDRFDPRAIVGLVRVGPPPRFDLYLLRALLHESAGLEDGAWFDWHAAKLAAGEDGEARRCAELGIERLERRHRKPR